MTLVAGISQTNPDLSLRDIAGQLERLHERTPRGSAKWSASSVNNLLDRARRLGLVAESAATYPTTRDVYPAAGRPSVYDPRLTINNSERLVRYPGIG